MILGQDELAAGNVRVKVLGLGHGHPEKDSVLVEKADVVAVVQKQLRQIKSTTK